MELEAGSGKAARRTGRLNNDRGPARMLTEIRTSGLMSGDGRRGNATAPVLDSTRMPGIRWRVWHRPIRQMLVSTPKSLRQIR